MGDGMSGGHGAVDGSNKGIALLISVLALFLAFGETLAKSAQTSALSENVEASNLWSFFQAKTIRMTVVRTASEAAELQHGAAPDDPYRKRVEEWNKTAARWDSEPSTGEGRKELAARATEAQHRRDLALARYHHYELGSAAFQIGIVLASAMVITGIAALAWAGAVLGVAGVAMLGIGLFAPHAVHLF
jgi:broad specificity phosphatase PhoE